MKQLLFSYGTLQREEVQISIFGRVLAGIKDVLRGYKIETIEIRDEVFLSRGEEKQQRTLVASGNGLDFIAGTVLELTEEELLLADQYEPDNYSRVEVILASGKGAWIYVASLPE